MRERAARAVQAVFAELGLAADLGRGGRASRRPATTPARCRIATARPTSRRPTSCSRAVSRGSTSRSRSTAPGSPMSPRPCSGCSASASSADYLQTSAVIDADGRRPLGGQRSERVPGPGNRLPPRGRALGAAPVPAAGRRSGRAARRRRNAASRSSPRAEPRQPGTMRREVVVAVGPAFADSIRRTIADLDHRDVLDAVCDGIREAAASRGSCACAASRTSRSSRTTARCSRARGSRIGLQSKGTAVIHRADLQPLDNLELFGMSPLYTLESYRAMGRNAAGYALGKRVGPGPDAARQLRAREAHRAHDAAARARDAGDRARRRPGRARARRPPPVALTPRATPAAGPRCPSAWARRPR